MTRLVSYYLKDASESEVYCRKQNKDEYYLTTDDPDKIYTLNSKKQKRYAQENSGKEVYATIAHNPIIIRNEYEKPIYAKNESKSEYYPTKDSKDVVFFDKDGNVIYAQDNEDKAFYPRDDRGNEFVVDNARLTNEDGTKLIHPRDVNGKSILYMHHLDEQPYIGDYQFEVDGDGDEMYPKDDNGDEYYPNDVAHSKNNLPLYAYKKDGGIIFDKNSRGDEIYLSNPDDLTDVITTKNGLHLPRYAQTVEKEDIYPKLTVNLSPFRQMEVILNNRYAQTLKGEPKYPLDMNGNEYTMNPLENELNKVFPIGYPITNEGKVIIPNANNEPYIKIGIGPSVTLDDIEGIIRPNWPWNGNDYLTNITAIRPSRSTRQYPYQVKPVKFNKKRSNTNQTTNGSKLPQQSGFIGLWKWLLGLLAGLVMIAIVFLKFAVEKKLSTNKDEITR